jgi:hypothetical protein
MNGQWSEWVDIDRACATGGVFGDYGIYEIRLLIPKTNTPATVFRFVGVDTSGLIYIGRSGFRRRGRGRTVANRLREWITQQHSGANTYSKAVSILDRSPTLADRKLQVRAMFVPDEQIAAAEAEALAEYFAIHAELPPCNSSTPGAFMNNESSEE